MKQTILHIIDSLETGGAETLLVGVVNGLEEYNHVIITLLPINKYEEKLSGIEVISLNYKNKLSTFRCVRIIKKIIMTRDVSIIHSHLLVATFLARLANPKDVSLFFTVHNTLSKSAFAISKLSRILEKWSYGENDVAIFVSEAVRSDYKACIGIKGENHVIYNFINNDFFNNQKTDFQLHQPIRLIAIGSLKSQKNYNFLIEALCQWSDRDFVFDIYGEGPLKMHLDHKVIELGLQSKVNLKGSVDNVSNIITEYDIYIMGSVYEGYGIAPVEAMASGIPTLLSDIEVLREVGENSSLFFDPHDSSSLIEKLELYVSSIDTRVKKSAEGMKRAKSIGNKGTHLHKIRKIYKDQCQQ